VRASYKVSATIFGCNAWQVYSDKKQWLGASDFSVATPGPPPVFETIWLNTNVFWRAWHKIFKSRHFEKHDWIVKVDPDAVFAPERLRQHMSQGHYDANARIFFKNCAQFHSMQGPLEIFSRGAVQALQQNEWKCKNEVTAKVGEDGFFQKCMEHIGAQAVEDWTLLDDQYCGQQPRPCNNKWTVAFHPFKPEKDYFSCMKNASLYVGPDY